MNRPMISPAQVRPVTADSATPGAPTFGNAGLETRNRTDFRHLWHTVLEKLWILILCTIAGLFLSLGYLARTPKLYQGHIVLEVDVQEPTLVRAEDGASRMRSMFLASQDALRTIEQNLTNRTLLARVIRSEGLAYDEGKALLGLSKTTAPTPKKETAPKSSETALTQTEQALGGALSTMVKPVVRRGTRLIDLFVLNQDPVLAQRLAEAVGREYIRSSIERRANFAEDTLRYLLEEEERLKANLQKSEAAVAEYKAKTPDALQLGGGANSNTGQNTGSRGGVEDKLQELNTKATVAKTERMRLEGELAQIEQAGDNLDALLAVPSIASAPAVVERRRDVAQVEAALATLSQRYKEKHPRMIAARAALNETRSALKATVLQQPAVLKNAIEQARATEDSLRTAAGEQEKAALALNKAAIGYQELARQADTDRALYESVLRQIKETDLTKGTKTNAVSVIEHSPLPGAPVSPSPMKAIALGLLGGIAAGLATIFGMNALDRSVKTVDQAETTFGLPVLAAIPEVSPDGKAGPQHKADTPPGTSSYRLVAEAPEGPAAEAFRNLRAALSLLGPETERKVFLFTSALPNEGKSFTSANYSLSLAQQGHRVLLIDGDLRRPSLHKIFRQVDSQENEAAKATDDQPGIVDYLVGDVALADAIRVVSARDVDIIGTSSPSSTSTVTATGGQLSVLAGGRRAPNPAELLSGHSFAELVAEASKGFDRVVIDSAPVLAVSDTLLMTPFVQTVCMVVRARRTARNAVQRAVLLLGGTGSRPVGVILNRLPRNRGTDYYYYYASHGYGAGEGSYTGGYIGKSRK
jgi:succinoglycan biosynthesis transport protein ExoP